MSKVVVYGGGVAALMAAVELAERRFEVDLVGPVAPWRWPMLPEAGIAVGEDPDMLFRETMACAAIAPAAPVRAMADAARALIDELEGWGVPFLHEPDGAFTLRRLPGTAEPSAAFVECRTGEHCARALMGRLMRHDVRIHEPFELESFVRDDGGRAIGIVTKNLVSQKLRAFSADAVIVAAGGPENIFGGTVACENTLCAALEAGAEALNVDCVQLHPAALRTATRLCLLSSAIRSETGRLWVPVDRHETRPPSEVPESERDVFVDALAADDVCARSVARVCFSERRGVYDAKQRKNRESVYLDISHLPEAHLTERLESELFACRIVTGIDAARAPIEVVPAAAGCLGGLRVDHDDHRTSIDGLYAVGDSASLYHGRCRLGGNGLLAAIFGARRGAHAAARYLESAPAARKIPKSAVRATKRPKPHADERITLETALGLRAGDPGEAQSLFSRVLLACRRERNEHDEPRSVRARLSADGDIVVSSEVVA